METILAPDDKALTPSTSSWSTQVAPSTSVLAHLGESVQLVSQNAEPAPVSAQTAGHEALHKDSSLPPVFGAFHVQGGEALQSQNEAEEGEVSDTGKTPTPEVRGSPSIAVKQEDEDNDVILVDGPPGASSRQLPGNTVSSRRTSVPLALNVGSTYSGRTASKDTSSQSVEPQFLRSGQRRTAGGRASPPKVNAARKERSERGIESSGSTRNREDFTRSRDSTSERRRKRAPDRRHDERDRTERRESAHVHQRKRRRRRSYTSSSGSSETSGSYSDDSSSSEYSGSSSSYTSSRSRSSTPERRRRRHRTAHHPTYAPQYLPQYSAVPVPMQMQLPLTVMHQPFEEELSRQQLSHMYRNMPSDPAELNVRASTSYASSPPRQAQNSFSFPDQADPAGLSMSAQPVHMRNSAPPMHPARAQAISNGQGSNPYEPSPPYNGQDRRRNGGPHSTAAMRRNVSGWPDPPPPAPRRNAGWPDDRPNRPRQDRRLPAAQSSWGGDNDQPASRADAWGGPSHSNSRPASGSAWGDHPSGGKADPWGDSATGDVVSSNDPWGSPPSASASTKPGEKAKGNVWGDGDSSTNNGSSAWA